MVNSDKRWVFDQSERAQDPIYIITSNHRKQISLGTIQVNMLMALGLGLSLKKMVVQSACILPTVFVIHPPTF